MPIIEPPGGGLGECHLPSCCLGYEKGAGEVGGYRVAEERWFNPIRLVGIEYSSSSLSTIK